MLKYNPSPAKEHERERDNNLLLPTLAWGGCIRQFSPSAAFAFLAAIQHDRAVAGLTTGLLASIGLILAGPTVTGIDSPETNHHLIHARPWYPLENPGIPSVPLSFRSCGRRHPAERTIRSEEKSHELQVRAKIGPWTLRKRSWIDAGIPPAVTALLTVVGRIDGLIHAHTLLRALADIYAD